MASSPVSTHSTSCLPDSAGKVAITASFIFLLAAAALATMIVLQHDPSLNTILYSVYGVMATLGFFLFVGAAINMCKSSATSSPAQMVVVDRSSFSYAGKGLLTYPVHS